MILCISLSRLVEVARNPPQIAEVVFCTSQLPMPMLLQQCQCSNNISTYCGLHTALILSSVPDWLLGTVLDRPTQRLPRTYAYTIPGNCYFTYLFI